MKETKPLFYYLGFILGYCFFTAVLFTLLRLLHRIPEGWTVTSIALITACVTLFGLWLKRLLA